MDQRIPGTDTPLGTTRASELDSDTSRSRGEQAKQKAREVGSKAADKIESAAAGQIDRATGELGALASALRDAGGRMNDDGMISGRIVRGAADKLDELSQRLDNRDLSEMVTEVRGWARRNPGAFIGAAVAVGFLASRFIKADNRDDFYRGYESGEDYSAGHMDTELYRGNIGTPYDSESSFGAGSTGGTGYGSTSDYSSGAGYSSGSTGSSTGSSPVGNTGSGSIGNPGGGAFGNSSSGSGFSGSGTTDRGFTGTSGNTGTGTGGTGSTRTGSTSDSNDSDETREGGR